MMRRVAALYVGAALIACSNPSDPVVVREITELVGPSAAVSLARGFSTKSIISIKRSSTFNGEVQLTAEGLSSGLLVSFAPATLSSSATLSEMTISALSNLAEGAHSFTVRASGEGVASKTLTVALTVTIPAITVAAQTATVNIEQGSSQEIPITITREGGFTGIVGVSMFGLPAGVTATFSPAALEPGVTATMLTLSAPLIVQPTAKTLTLRASAQGIPEKTIPIELNVTPATSPAVLVSASPGLLTVSPGVTAETQLTLQRFAGFSAAANVIVEDLPANLVATADPFAAGSNTTTLRVTPRLEQCGSLYLGGTYQASVRVTGQGIPDALTVFAVVDNIGPQFNVCFRPDVSGAFLQGSKAVSVSRGGTATIPIAVGRVQFAFPVSLSIGELPANVATNLPATHLVGDGDFALQVSAAMNATPGVYNLVIRGESTISLVREITLVLTVN